MNILLDTHIILWALYGDDHLPDKARKLIIDPSNTIFYSSVSTWEVLLKHDRKPGELHYDLQRFLDGCLGAGFSPLNLCDRHIAAVETLERPETVPEHNDPFDKLLLAQAKTENLLFLTHDRKIDQYDEPCVFLV